MFDPARKLLEKTRNPARRSTSIRCLPERTAIALQQAREAMAAARLPARRAAHDRDPDQRSHERRRAHPRPTRRARSWRRLRSSSSSSRKCEQNLHAGNLAAARRRISRKRARSTRASRRRCDVADDRRARQRGARLPRPRRLRLRHVVRRRRRRAPSAPAARRRRPPTSASRSKKKSQPRSRSFVLVRRADAPAPKPPPPAPGATVLLRLAVGRRAVRRLLVRQSDARTRAGGFYFDAAPRRRRRAPATSISRRRRSRRAPRIRRRSGSISTDGDRAFEAGDYQQAIDLWSRIFLIDVTNEQASERIERREGEAARDRAEGRVAPRRRAIARTTARIATPRAPSSPRCCALDPNNITAQDYLDRADGDRGRGRQRPRRAVDTPPPRTRSSTSSSSTKSRRPAATPLMPPDPDDRRR